MRPCHLTTAILVVLVASIGFESAAQNRRWLSYEPAVVELQGKLAVEWKHGPPNYGEQPKTDAKVRVPLLKLAETINVRGNPENALNAESVEGVRQIQLLFQSESAYKQLIGKQVVVKGTLFRAHSGHHYTDVVMNVRFVEEKK